MLDFVATSSAVRVMGSPAYKPALDGPPLDLVMMLGFFAAFLTLVLWLENRSESKPKILAFAGCIGMLSIYCFLAGAWPMGIVAMVWCIVSARQRVVTKRKVVSRQRIWFGETQRGFSTPVDMESRMSRMFGRN
jgi:hypothetical protein